MKFRRITLVVLSLPFALGLAVTAAPAASAAELTITDPAHDNVGPGLDIIGATLDNADYAVTGTMNFRVIRAGVAIVSLKAHNRSVLRLVSTLKSDGTSRDRLLDRNGRIACADLEVSWNPGSASVTFVAPSSCLWKGNDGALRSPWLLTEVPGAGSDVDDAGPTEWLPRG